MSVRQPLAAALRALAGRLDPPVCVLRGVSMGAADDSPCLAGDSLIPIGPELRGENCMITASPDSKVASAVLNRSAKVAAYAPRAVRAKPSASIVSVVFMIISAGFGVMPGQRSGGGVLLSSLANRTKGAV